MKILLEQVITGDEEKRITWIDGTIDNEEDAKRAKEVIDSFDEMMISAGVFNDNDHINLAINGDSIGYYQLDTWQDLVVFLGGEVDIDQQIAEGGA